MFRKLSLGFVVGLLAHSMFASGPVNMASTDLMVPAAGRGDGAAGSFWTTDLWIRCPGGGEVTLDFHAWDSPSGSPTATATIRMGEPVAYLADVVKNLFGLDAGFGNIRIRSQFPASATMRVFSPGGGGSYGLAFMAMPGSMSMGSPPMMGGGDFYRFYVQGLLPQPQARVNVMVMNTGATPIQGVVEVLDSDGGTPATGPASLRFAVQPYSGHQFGNVLEGVRSRFANDMGLQLRIQLDPGASGTMMALASVVDNATNDGYVVMGSMMEASGAMMGH
jgi:hypothetical protein